MFGFLETFKAAYMRNKGQKLLMKGRPWEAYPYLEMAVLMDSNYNDLYNLVLALLSMNKKEEAEAYLSKIVEQVPDNPTIILTLIELYTMKRSWEKAEKLMRQLCEYYPSNVNFAKYLERIAHPKKRENYIKAKELMNSATTDIIEGRHEDGYQKLKKGEQLDPENPYIHNHLGTIYLRLKKKPDKAFEHYHKAYKLAPTNSAFKQNLENARKKIAE